MPPVLSSTAGGSAPAPAVRSWRDRWFDWRNRRLADPAFRRWAAAFPLTRPIARARAGELFDLVAGFVYSQVLLAWVRLRVADELADGALPVAEIAVRLGLDPAAADRLLAAAAALRLAQRRPDGRFGLGVLGASLRGNEGVLAMVEHHGALYADLADPVALLARDRSAAGGRLQAYWPYAGSARPETLAPDQVAAYSALMSASQPLVAGEIVGAYDLGRHRTVLDVGGGEGTFLLEVARRAPHLRLMLFDLPAVAQRAGVRLAQAGHAARAQVTGGDFLRDPLPRGADLVTLVRVVHDHDDAAVLRLLRAVHDALPPGGRVLLAEPMAGTPGARAMGDAYFGFYLLAMGSGRPRTAERLAEMLRASGFVDIERRATHVPMQVGVLLGKTRINAAV